MARGYLHNCNVCHGDFTDEDPTGDLCTKCRAGILVTRATKVLPPKEKEPLVQCSKCYGMRKKSRSHTPCFRCGSIGLTSHNREQSGTGLPKDAAARKGIPLYSGLIKYFPDALAAVARLSKIGNDQHNPGEPLHWAREKSGDELDALMRHIIDAGTEDTDGVLHSTKVAWRALANLQKELEKRANPDGKDEPGEVNGRVYCVHCGAWMDAPHNHVRYQRALGELTDTVRTGKLPE